MRSALIGALITLGLLLAAAAWVWRYHPEWLPDEWRRQNRHSRDYAPVLYRWHDDAGRVQLTDTPPADGRRYQAVQIDPNRNIVPTTLPPPGSR